MRLNTQYLQSNRGFIKIAEIIIEIVIACLLCSNYYLGRSNCITDGRLGYSSILNFVCLIINVVLLFLNLVTLATWGLERIYSIICSLLFLVALGLLIWYHVEYRYADARLIICTILFGVQFLLYLFDVKILQGEAPNWS